MVVRLAETRESLMALLLNNLLVPVVAALLVAVALVLVLRECSRAASCGPSTIWA